MPPHIKMDRAAAGYAAVMDAYKQEEAAVADQLEHPRRRPTAYPEDEYSLPQGPALPDEPVARRRMPIQGGKGGAKYGSPYLCYPMMQVNEPTPPMTAVAPLDPASLAALLRSAGHDAAAPSHRRRSELLPSRAARAAAFL
eukprot:TRINITY_DN65309_c0_g1_i1.p2 TRINITY_DN65309_c0_g1~~TRINITY_DN65309_c0_g1_i1.p2  ORF type:complete len:141 (+),score=22.79 TRINITY_DN65309_c0_g1_i1:148-570(+)